MDIHQYALYEAYTLYDLCYIHTVEMGESSVNSQQKSYFTQEPWIMNIKHFKNVWIIYGIKHYICKVAFTGHNKADFKLNALRKLHLEYRKCF